MKVAGVPAGIKADEARIVLTPSGAPELVPDSKAVFASEPGSPTDREVAGLPSGVYPAGSAVTYSPVADAVGLPLLDAGSVLGHGPTSTSQEIS